MPPALLMLRAWEGPWALPLPLFLLWPLHLAGYALAALAWLLRLDARAALWTLLEMLRHLRGMEIDVDAGRRRIHLWFV